MSLVISSAQTIDDGTIASEETITMLLNNLAQEENFRNTTADAQVDLTFYVVDNNSGEEGIKENIVINTVDAINIYFSDIYLTFEVKEIIPIHHIEYNNIDTTEKAETLAKHFSNPLSINVYLVDQITLENVPYYGFTYFPNDTNKNFIYLSKPSFNSANFAQQVGHFFGLLNTHEIINGAENVEREDCDFLGDLICDTYADPYLKNNVDPENCLYNGSAKDNKNEYFQPSVANIMSSAPEECRCIFTEGQLKRMHFYLNKFRYKLVK